MKIQQMSFMILATFLFFVLVGLFFANIQLRGINSNFDDLQLRGALNSIEVIADMPEFNCDARESFCVDEDKLRVMASSSELYRDFWPVASIRVYLVSPFSTELVRCPAENCNYFEVYDSGQRNVKEISTFVSVCKKNRVQNYVYDECRVGKLAVGVEE